MYCARLQEMEIQWHFCKGITTIQTFSHVIIYLQCWITNNNNYEVVRQIDKYMMDMSHN